jgi:FKBP-type peptidyl-prolyl cis-trans isomerase
MRSLLFFFAVWIVSADAFLPATSPSRSTIGRARQRLDARATAEESPSYQLLVARRDALQTILLGSTTATTAAGILVLRPEPALAIADKSNSDQESSMYAPKFVQQYADFIETPEGWSYREVTPGSAGKDVVKAAMGDRVVFDWSGYTIGYFGRPFQAKGGPQGGAFDKDNIDYERTVLGSGTMVKGLECAMVGRSAGQVLQIVVPFEQDLSYPADDPNHTRVGPKPTTFSGQRALNFVLENPRIDRTLLFNVKIIRIDKPNAQGGFTRG